MIAILQTKYHNDQIHKSNCICITTTTTSTYKNACLYFLVPDDLEVSDAWNVGLQSGDVTDNQFFFDDNLNVNYPPYAARLNSDQCASLSLWIRVSCKHMKRTLKQVSFPDLCLQIDLLLIHDISTMLTQGCSSGNVQEFKLHVGNTSLESQALFDRVTGYDRVRKYSSS